MGRKYCTMLPPHRRNTKGLVLNKTYYQWVMSIPYCYKSIRVSYMYPNTLITSVVWYMDPNIIPVSECTCCVCSVCVWHTCMCIKGTMWLNEDPMTQNEPTGRGPCDPKWTMWPKMDHWLDLCHTCMCIKGTLWHNEDIVTQMGPCDPK